VQLVRAHREYKEGLQALQSCKVTRSESGKGEIRLRLETLDLELLNFEQLNKEFSMAVTRDGGKIYFFGFTRPYQALPGLMRSVRSVGAWSVEI